MALAKSLSRRWTPLDLLGFGTLYCEIAPMGRRVMSWSPKSRPQMSRSPFARGFIMRSTQSTPPPPCPKAHPCRTSRLSQVKRSIWGSIRRRRDSFARRMGFVSSGYVGCQTMHEDLPPTKRVLVAPFGFRTVLVTVAMHQTVAPETCPANVAPRHGTRGDR
jgi:hypothetical protein